MAVMSGEPADRPAWSASHRWAAYLLGFAIGGFFDGILLHQILQWHHLFAGLEGGRFDDLAFQIMADGLFHLIMYVVGGVGLWLLWRARREFALPGAGRLLVANALLGFGLWHVIDAVASHWLLGIHRIRMDSEMPLFWDLVWVALFGVVPLMLGYLLRPPGNGPQRSAAPAALAVLAVIGGAAAALPPRDAAAGPVIVVFRPAVTPEQAFAAMSAVGGRLVWSDPADRVWAIHLPEGGSPLPLYTHGAMMVSGSIVPLGCLDWFRS